MSGGSLDYFYRQVTDTADEIRSRAKTPRHRALADHLDKVAAALHDLEWVWSLDSAPGSENQAIDAVISPVAVLGVALAQARRAQSDLAEAISDASKHSS